MTAGRRTGVFALRRINACFPRLLPDTGGHPDLPGARRLRGTGEKKGEEAMGNTQLSSDQRIISYLTLRKAIGVIGTLLPFVLAGVYMLLVSKIVFQASISAYYYTSMRNVLVGNLCAIGVFLFAYRGYDWQDNLCTNAAGVFAIGVAFCPTTPPDPSPTATVLGYLHLAFAGLLFSMLAIISLFLFTRTGSPGERPAQKRKRDVVYHICGCVIVACLLLVPVEAFVLGQAVAGYQPLFWLEAVAIVAFGVAWLVKGQAILKDPPSAPPPPPARVLAGQSTGSL
jgi:hypothetical protein